MLEGKKQNLKIYQLHNTEHAVNKLHASQLKKSEVEFLITVVNKPSHINNEEKRGILPLLWKQLHLEGILILSPAKANLLS